MSHEEQIKSPKKLIEVALPLDAINKASAREKSIRHGHPSTLHLWWARRPLAAARAVIFSQLVNDPEELWRFQNPGKEPNKQVRGHWTKARARLFKIVEDLVLWENTTNEEVLNIARAEIRKSWLETCELNKDHPLAAELFDPKKMPGLHDPFAGGGAIPLEAQRLGLDAYASDLNPVAVLINKAMIEIPPKFDSIPPVNPGSRSDKRLVDRDWRGTEGLSEDVRYYGKWMRDEAEKRIGHLFPKVEISDDMVDERPDLEPYLGKNLTVLAWLWTRTVKSPNPAYSNLDVPLASTFVLSSKSGKEAWVEPIIEEGGYHFVVRTGAPPAEAKKGMKAARGANFRCIMSKSAISPEHIKSEAMAGRMGAKMLAIVAGGTHGRIYLTPNSEHESVATSVALPDTSAIQVAIAKDPRPMTCLTYGMTQFDHLFTRRQLAVSTTLSDIISELFDRIMQDSVAAGLEDDGRGLALDSCGAKAYGEAVCVYLAFAISKVINIGSSLASWMSDRGAFRETFARQALPIIWDYAEANCFSDSGGSFLTAIDKIAMAIRTLPSHRHGIAMQVNASTQQISSRKYVSTDPPYYDSNSRPMGPLRRKRDEEAIWGNLPKTRTNHFLIGSVTSGPLP